MSSEGAEAACAPKELCPSQDQGDALDLSRALGAPSLPLGASRAVPGGLSLG